MSGFSTLFLVKTFAERRLVVCAQGVVYEFDGSTWTDITGNPVNSGVDERWSGGWLTGALTLANGVVTRTYKPGIDANTVPMQYDPFDGSTWESRNYSAKVFRPFRNYMLAGNVNWNGVVYPSRVQWCDTVSPGQVPDDWVPIDSNRAGDVDLADTPGDIVDMAPLRDTLLVYKEDSIHTCQWVGGNPVFSFRRLTTAKGIHSRDCVAEFSGRHWCQGLEDIFLVDGNTPTSLVWGRLKRTWLADRDPDKVDSSWVAHDPVNEEMLFAYVSRNAPADWVYPDKILVCNLRHNAWFFRDYQVEMPHAKYTLDVVDQASADLVFHGIDRTNERLLDLESAPTQDGVAVSAYVERTGLFSDPGHDWVQVDRAKLQLSGNQAQLRLGDQIAISAPVTWRPQFSVDPATDYKTDARTNGNLIAYRIDISTLADWQISNLNLLVQKSGSRG